MYRFTGMKFSFRSIISFITVVLIVMSCSKGNNTDDNSGGPVHTPSPNDTIAPVVTINTPANNQVFNSGNIINVSGRVTDDLGLYRGNVRITNDANGSLLKEQLYEIHGVIGYNFAVSYTANVAVPSDYTVTVSFQDHGLNTTARSVKVKVNP